MARPTKENERITIMGKKLQRIKKYSKIENYHTFFGVGATTLTRFMNGDSSPSMYEMRSFIANFASINNGQVLDINWLINDFDIREGPIFVTHWQSVAEEREQQIRQLIDLVVKLAKKAGVQEITGDYGGSQESYDWMEQYRR